MAKQLKQINELQFLKDYESREVSIRVLCREYGINSARGTDILKRHNSRKYRIKSARHAGHPVWNKGLSKKDPRVAAYSRKLSDVRVKTGVRSGYQTVFCNELNKRVKLHDYIWWQNTGHWPEGKKGEQVHHIDGDKDNNEFDNLLLTNVTEHSTIHKEYEDVFLRLLRLGVLKFDKVKRGVDWKSFDEMVNLLKVSHTLPQ